MFICCPSRARCRMMKSWVKWTSKPENKQTEGARSRGRWRKKNKGLGLQICMQWKTCKLNNLILYPRGVIITASQCEKQVHSHLWKYAGFFNGELMMSSSDFWYSTVIYMSLLNYSVHIKLKFQLNLVNLSDIPTTLRISYDSTQFEYGST